MILLDAYGLVALIVEEPAADDVEGLLREGDAGIVIANLAEAIDISQRVHKVDAEAVRASLEPLFITDVLEPVVSRVSDAWLAAELRARHYDRRKRPLSLADCFLLAHAVATKGRIATSDPPLADAARFEGVEIVALADSAGNRP